MKKPLTLIAILCAMTTSSYAEHTPVENSIFGQFRVGYVNIDDNAGSNTDTLAVGGKLAYNSKNYRGFSAGATFYTTNPIAGVDDEGMFLDSDLDGYSILGEAFVHGKFGKTAIKLGRQELDTPFADTDDVGMIPNTFEALRLVNNSLANTTLIAAHLHRWTGVDAPEPGKFTRMNGAKGVNVVAAIYEPSDKWNLQGWHYRAKNATHISYLETALNPTEKLGLRAQYATQSGGAFNGDVWGVAAEYALGDLSLSAAHNKVSGGQVSNGFGGGPFFTSAEDHTIAEADKQKATSLGIEYGGIKNLTLAAAHVDFNKGENELDVSASYKFSKNLTADLIYSDMNNDGKLTRAFLNYNF